jgi:2-iminobutanoate/2-iminopropanoate deaminase
MTTQSSPSPRNWQPVSLGPSVPAPVGAYSPAVRAGNLLFVSGQVPIDPRTGELVGKDVTTQTHQVLKNLVGVLDAAGAKLTDIVSVSVFLADENDWTTFNNIYKAAMTPPYPARTAVGASLRGGVLVEVNAIAVMG